LLDTNDKTLYAGKPEMQKKLLPCLGFELQEVCSDVM